MQAFTVHFKIKLQALFYETKSGFDIIQQNIAQILYNRSFLL